MSVDGEETETEESEAHLFPILSAAFKDRYQGARGDTNKILPNQGVDLHIVCDQCVCLHHNHKILFCVSFHDEVV